MNLKFGSNLFLDVSIPVLWGQRALIQDTKGRLSVIDLSGSAAVLEVLGDEPAPETEYRPVVDGFQILRGGKAQFKFNPTDHLLTALSSRLPEIQISPHETRVGTNTFSGNSVIGMAVGIVVTEQGIQFGVSNVPEGLADLVV